MKTLTLNGAGSDLKRLEQRLAKNEIKKIFRDCLVSVCTPIGWPLSSSFGVSV